MLLQLEGTDRVGKTTIAKKLLEILKKRNVEVELFKFPYRKTKIGKIIDEMLQFPKFEWNEGVVFQLLQTANRMEFFPLLKEWQDKNNGVMILDRYSLSSIVYGKIDNFPYDLLIDLQLILPLPEVTVILTADVPSLERRLKEKEIPEVYETIEKIQKIQEAYFNAIKDIQKAALERLNKKIEYFIIDNSDNKLEYAISKILEILEHKLKIKFTK